MSITTRAQPLIAGRRRGGLLLAMFLLACALATSAVAQELPGQQRGVSADTAYQAGDLDEINLFNGNLTVRLPLGPTYPVGPSLAYGLSLTYNSNGWDFEDDSSCFEPGNNQLFYYTVGKPDSGTNAGFGWRLSLGKLEDTGGLKRPVYVSPDGGRHTFYASLHPGPGGSTFPPAGTQEDTWFTNDSTYLRMRRYAPGAGVCREVGGGDCRTVELPGGIIHEFHVEASGSEEWRPTRMRDRFGNFVDIFYPDADTWRLVDSHGREQVVELGDGRVERLRLSTFGGGTATWSLEYESLELERQAYYPPACAPEGDLLTVQVLKRLVRPDGAYFELDYHTDSRRLSGALATLRLPTGGGYRWGFDKIDFSSQIPDNPEAKEWARTAHPVISKELWERDGSTLGAWSYAYETVGTPSAPGDVRTVPCYHATTVTDPAGHDRVHYFATTASLQNWAYGLPFTMCAPRDGAFSATGPFLSEEVYEGSVANGRKLRTVLVDYESDGRFSGLQQDKNHRLRLRREIFHDDGDRFREVRYEDFDGLGNYRTVVSTGNLSSAPLGERRVTLGFDPNRGSYRVLDPDTSTVDPQSTFAMPERDDPWILETPTHRRVEERGAVEHMELCTDPASGFLLRRRVWAGSQRSSADVVTVYEPEQASGVETGRVARERYYGGDDQAQIGNGALCGLALPSTPRYRVEHTWSAGTLESSWYVEPRSGQAVLPIRDQEIDTATGLVAASRDSAGVETRFDYDLLGRLTGEQPPEGARAEYIYALPSRSTPDREPSLVVRRCDPGASGCSGDDLLAWQRSYYDGLGRLVREARRVPEGGGIAIHERSITYDAAGRRASRTVWNNPDLATTYEGYDRFGRVGRITPPGSPATRFTYLGERVVSRETQVVADTRGGLALVHRSELYDHMGRLSTVCEGESSAWDERCDGLETRYGYDAGNRLTSVCSAASEGACGQERQLIYDGRGLLVAERHPELGVIGNGWASYAYDALGNRLSRVLEGSTGRELRYGYDAAGRRTRVEEVVAGSIRPLVEHVYAEANVGADLARGKLRQSRRHNWVRVVLPIYKSGGARKTRTFDVVIGDTYTYEGLDGRTSNRRTDYQLDSTTYSFETSWDHDELGRLGRVSYPRCLHAGCSGADPARSVSYHYLRGYLRTVAGFAEQISYQAGGMVHRVRHVNGVDWQLDIDPASGLERPYRITTDRGWDSGFYTYDGAGNVAAIGEQGYAYDSLGRLLRAEVAVGGEERLQELSYDDFGNILSVTTGGLERSNEVDSASNRLRNHGSSYDAAGNVVRLALDGVVYHYEHDALDMMTSLRSTRGEAQVFLYDADGERVATFDCPGGGCGENGSKETWTLRGLDGEVLRVFSHPWGEGWQWQHDYVYRDGQLLAAVRAEGGGQTTDHFHLDHLGTPRQITDQAGLEVARHDYFPFGEEATEHSQSAFELKFTGHERDQNGAIGELDYMHARYCSPRLGRFLSVDPELGHPGAPQSWNRYAYVRNNPLAFNDPNGRSERAQLMLDTEVIDFLETGQEPSFLDPTLQGAGILGLTLLTPGPDELIVGALLKGATSGARTGGLLAKAKSFLRKLAGKDAAPSLPSAVDDGARSVANAGRLRKNLASQQQLGEVRTNAQPFAGAGTGTRLRDVDSLVRDYGGKAADWSKVRSSTYKGADGASFEIQAYKNVKTGQIVQTRSVLK